MSNIDLDYGQNTTKATGSATSAGQNYTMITARTTGTVTYTETYEGGTTEVFTAEDISAGQTFYGVFSLVSAPTGHIVLCR